MQEQNQTSNNPAMDITPKAIGIGGIFFFTENTEATNAWYAKNLGLETSPYGVSFESRDVNQPEVVNTLQWSPFKKGSDYFAPSQKDFMINYRVQHIEALVDQLKANGVIILDELASYEYGKFIHILDHEGNKLQLWEPVVEKR